MDFGGLLGVEMGVAFLDPSKFSLERADSRFGFRTLAFLFGVACGCIGEGLLCRRCLLFRCRSLSGQGGKSMLQLGGGLFCCRYAYDRLEFSNASEKGARQIC
ncbi:MAG: hypothetical protein JXQ71_13870 [Verrucomicrobia bacterium]|nr:hypothetical protein [Verrucomicrobiota bacterium]